MEGFIFLKCETGVQGVWDVISMHELAGVQRKCLANIKHKLTFSSAAQTIGNIITNIPPWMEFKDEKFQKHVKTMSKSKLNVPQKHQCFSLALPFQQIHDENFIQGLIKGFSP